MRRRIVTIGILLLLAGIAIASIPTSKEEPVYTAEDIQEPFDAARTLNPPPSPSNLTFWGVYIENGNFVKFELTANGIIRVEIYTVSRTLRERTTHFNETGTSFTQIYPIFEGDTYYIQIRNQNPDAVTTSGKIRVQKTVVTKRSYNTYPYAIWGLGVMVIGFAVLIAGIFSKQKTDIRMRKSAITR